MLRIAALAVLLSACTSYDDSPILTAATGDGALLITLERAPDHTFGTLSATVNGADAGSAVVSPGHVPGSNASPFADQASGGYAMFEVPLASLTTPGAQIVLTEDGEPFLVDVPDLLKPRALHLASTVFRPGDSVVVDTGIATDAGQGLFIVRVNGVECFSSADSVELPGAIGIKVPADIAGYWMCGPLPAPGTAVAVSLELHVWPHAQIARCEGASLTCGLAGMQDLDTTFPATLQF